MSKSSFTKKSDHIRAAIVGLVGKINKDIKGRLPDPSYHHIRLRCIRSRLAPEIEIALVAALSRAGWVLQHHTDEGTFRYYSLS